METDQPFGVPFPTEKWTKLAELKLHQGYELIIGDRSASLFMRGRGYEPCPYRIARLLVDNGIVASIGEDNLGVRYRHVPGARFNVPLHPKPEPDDEEGVLMEDDVDDGEAAVDPDDLAEDETDPDEDLALV